MQSTFGNFSPAITYSRTQKNGMRAIWLYQVYNTLAGKTIKIRIALC